MDSFEASAIVFSRIRKLEPEDVTNKIIGYLLLQGCSQEMIRLAFGPDPLIHNLIHRIKTHLGLGPKPVLSPPIPPPMNLGHIPDLSFIPFSPVQSPGTLRAPNPYWDTQVNSEHQAVHNPQFIPIGYTNPVSEDFRLHHPTQLADLEEHSEPVNPEIKAFPSDYHFPEAPCSRSQMLSPLSELPIKACHYFNKGFCKHGSNCRYFHGQPFPISNEVAYDEPAFSPQSLAKLEFEITELLKSRRGGPVSIASLPMLYYEKYGRTLQADGYLTESQRHGKAGYSLTKLLARLKNSVRLIDRPHGQHSVILAEDAPKYMENYQGERNDPGYMVSGSRQIYLTFPAESTFTEDDVAIYFNTFGPVQDVRIPCQDRRMFGFVTFATADTVKMILSKGNPHFVCGARVLVKPYKEKSKLVDRKYPEKLEPPIYYNSRCNTDSELHSKWESSLLLRKRFVEEKEKDLDIQIRRLSKLQLAHKPLADHSYFNYSLDELKASEDPSKFPSAERVSNWLDVVNSGTTNDDNLKDTVNNHTDENSNQGLDLPDSPFTSFCRGA